MEENDGSFTIHLKMNVLQTEAPPQRWQSFQTSSNGVRSLKHSKARRGGVHQGQGFCFFLLRTPPRGPRPRPFPTTCPHRAGATPRPGPPAASAGGAPAVALAAVLRHDVVPLVRLAVIVVVPGGPERERRRADARGQAGMRVEDGGRPRTKRVTFFGQSQVEQKKNQK